MTISWSRVVPHDEAARRAAGRRRINAQRYREAERRRDQVVRMVQVYGLAHGVRQRIANELDVHRSTISRDIQAAIYAEPELLLPTPRTANTEWIRELETLGARLAAEGCGCDDKAEPRHSLGHVMKFVAETLDVHERSKVELPKGGQELFRRVRALLGEVL